MTGWNNDRSNNKPWPKEQVDLLRALAATGISARQIAAGINKQMPTAQCTKGAVIGQCFRHQIKLKGRPGGRGRNQGGWNKKRRENRIGGIGRSKQSGQWTPGLGKAEPLPEIEPASETACSLFDLTDGQCRWPVAGNLYCGRPSLFCDRPRASAYCAQHTMTARR